MNDYAIRVVEPDGYRAANDVFHGSLQVKPVSDEHWPNLVGSYEPGRTYSAFHGDEQVGTTASFASELLVPGGALLPMAMVSRVGVRSDHTRRGVLTSLMRAQLTGLAEPIATLRASEGVIYGRFGYGVATRGRSIRVNRARAIGHPGAPTGGRVRIVAIDDAMDLMPAIYARFGPGRPGWVSRSGIWWDMTRFYASLFSKSPVVFAVHHGPDGDDGFAVYSVTRADWEQPNPRSVLHVEDFMAFTTDAWAGLWRFLLSVDLVHDVKAHLRPLDEPVEQLFVDNRAVDTLGIDDETWLRLVDVPSALAARSYGELSRDAGSVVIEVRDALLPANSGRYRLGDGPAVPVGEPAELLLDVADLGALYLGDIAPSALAATGRLTAEKADAVSVADRLFAIAESPWCGSYF
ncbi:MAG TPA: GNAT family N-acetyltransferase [Pseudonocardiaceae bacterium]|nr:GNAT family N-acetyltransferase [Pseudonocardiaceae bacterium]